MLPSPALPLGGIKPSPPAWSLPEGVTAFITNLYCPPPHSPPQFSKADSLDFTECILESDLPCFLVSCLLCLKCSLSVCLPKKLSSASRQNRHCFPSLMSPAVVGGFFIASTTSFSPWGRKESDMTERLSTALENLSSLEGWHTLLTAPGAHHLHSIYCHALWLQVYGTVTEVLDCDLTKVLNWVPPAFGYSIHPPNIYHHCWKVVVNQHLWDGWMNKWMTNGQTNKHLGVQQHQVNRIVGNQLAGEEHFHQSQNQMITNQQLLQGKSKVSQSKSNRIKITNEICHIFLSCLKLIKRSQLTSELLLVSRLNPIENEASI